MKLNQFFSRFPPLIFKKGEIILQPDNSSDGIYFIHKGYIRAYSLTEWGDEKLYLIYKHGEILPIFWVFDDLPLTKYYEALHDVTVFKSSKQDFFQYLQNDPEALSELMEKMNDVLHVLTDRIDCLEYTNAYARLVMRLLYLAKRFGERQGKEVIIKAPLTHKDIANSIAMTRETASRQFEKLEKKGIVGYKNHTIIIYDIIHLEGELEHLPTHDNES